MARQHDSRDPGASANARPTLTELGGDSDNHFAQFARNTWLEQKKSTSTVKVKPDKLKRELWDVLEGEDFSPHSLLILDNLQCLERSVIY